MPVSQPHAELELLKARAVCTSGLFHVVLPKPITRLTTATTLNGESTKLGLPEVSQASADSGLRAIPGVCGDLRKRVPTPAFEDSQYPFELSPKAFPIECRRICDPVEPGFPQTFFNQIELSHEGRPARAALLSAIRSQLRAYVVRA